MGRAESPTIRVPPRRPPVFPSTLRPAVNQQKRRPLLPVVLTIPLRLQNPALNLPLRTLKVELFSSIKVFTFQLFLGEPRELAHWERSLSVGALDFTVPRVVWYIEFVKPADHVDVVRLRERVLRVKEAAARQGLDGANGVLVGECQRRGKFLIGTRFRSGDRKHENFDASVASGSEINILVVFGELK